MTKKNTYLLILLMLLFVLCLGAGVYFLLQPKNNSSQNYNVDKYNDLVNWCDTSTKEKQLNIDCRAILLEIRIIDENNSCADAQIITKDNELKNISVCESGSVISYSNDVLAYKKLMPIDIKLTYDKKNDTNDYNLSHVSAIQLDNTYVQDIVNKDITSLVALDPTSTTIKNSVDFCPNPSMLKSYVSEDNKNKYTDFYNNNILSEKDYINLFTEEFNNKFLENWTDPIIKVLFGCESSTRLGYKTICNTTPDKEYKNVELSALPSFVSDWNNQANTDSDLISLKNLSLVFDGMLYKQPHENYSSTWIVGELFQFISEANNNQNVYCNSYKIYKNVAKDITSIETQLNQIRTLVSNNILSSSQMCLATLDNSLYNKEGLYLKSLYTKDDANFSIYNRCNNLYSLINDKS